MDEYGVRNETAWRAQMLAGQAAMRQSINELAFVVSGLFLAYLMSDYLPGAALVVGAAMCGGAIYGVWRENRISQRFLHELAPKVEAEQAH